MPRYYFDIHDSKGLHTDEIGDDFVDLDEAIDQAQSILPDIVREELPDGDRHDVSCDVRDEGGSVVYQAELTYRGKRL